MKFICIKRADNLLQPVYKSDHDIVARIKDGEMVLLDFRKSRNPLHHKLVFGMAKCCLENMSGGWGRLYMMDPKNTPYKFIKALMLDCGITDDFIKLNGEVVQVPKSIAFEAMDEDEFEGPSAVMSAKCAEMLDVPVHEFRRNYKKYL